jgi:Transposase and inactivated derivatives
MTKRARLRYFKIGPEIIRFWCNRFGPIFAAEIRRNRFSRVCVYSNWKWHLGEVFVKVTGETRYLWRAVITRVRSWKATFRTGVIVNKY